MTRRKNRSRPPSSSDRGVGSVTARIVQITALCTALLTLAGLILSRVPELKEMCLQSGLCVARQCVEIRSLTFPDEVELDEWDGEQIVVRVRANCSPPRSLYMAFTPRESSEPRFAELRAPHGDSRECSGAPALLKPDCWDRKRPLKLGEWEWKVLLPPLEKVSDPRSVERLSIYCEIRDSDVPTASPIAADVATIEVRNGGAT